MQFNVKIVLKPAQKDKGRGIRIINKKIEADNEEQAKDFAEQFLVGFLAEGVTVEVGIVDADNQTMLQNHLRK